MTKDRRSVKRIRDDALGNVVEPFSYVNSEGKTVTHPRTVIRAAATVGKLSRTRRKQQAATIALVKNPDLFEEMRQLYLRELGFPVGGVVTDELGRTLDEATQGLVSAALGGSFGVQLYPPTRVTD